MKILVYSGNPFQVGEIISAGSPDLVEIPVQMLKPRAEAEESAPRLSRALLSTAQATAVQVDNIASPLPSTFALGQNYPNPFNPNTTIEFSLGAGDGGGSGQRVRLDIYNILGQSVKTLVDKYMPPGNHQAEWDGTSQDGQPVASGMYLYRLQVGSDSQTRKMLLLK